MCLVVTALLFVFVKRSINVVHKYYGAHKQLYIDPEKSVDIARKADFKDKLKQLSAIYITRKELIDYSVIDKGCERKDGHDKDK